MRILIKIILLIVTTLVFPFLGIAQKPNLSDTTYRTFTSLRYGQINCNGKFISYIIENMPLNKNTLVVVSADSTYEKRFVSYSNAVFSDDGAFLYAKNRDTLMKLRLGTNEIVLLPNCKSYDLINSKNKNFFIYQSIDDEQTLTIEEMETGKKKILSKVKSYTLNKAGSALITKNNTDTTVQETMLWVDLLSGRSKVIYKGNTSSSQIFDACGGKMAFITNNNNEMQVWYYDKYATTAQMIANDHSIGISAGHQISLNAIWTFAQDGKNLFFTQGAKKEKESDSKDVKIWSSNDGILLAEYEGSGYYSKKSAANGVNLSILNIKNKEVRQLLNGSQKVIPSGVGLYQNILIVRSAFAPGDEAGWNNSAKSSYYLCFINTGKLKIIKENCAFGINQIQLSPDQRYLLYFDPEQGNYISYNIKTQQRQNLTKGMKETFYTYFPIDRNQIIPENRPDAVPGFSWIAGTHRVVVHGTFDLWELDVENKIPPINLTGGKGTDEKIIYSLLVPQFEVLQPGFAYDLSALDVNTKEYGLCRFILGKKSFRQTFKTKNAFDLQYTSSSYVFKKALYADAYLFTLANASTSENIFYTSDFKKIKPLSNNYPEKKYNWFTSELLYYLDIQGNPCEGIIYKPENFNPQGRYPVIFYYYLDITTEFNKYKEPNPSNYGINIPLLTSNGYIVCTPNIYRTRGKPGEAALISVLAAADHLAHYNWIDTARMGISGHSLGGFETDYIISHTNRFKAAMSAAGPTSLIDSYNETFGSHGASMQSYVRDKALVMGGGLDEIPDAYIQNSPILFANKIKTPLLLMHNQDDTQVPVEHTKKLFTQMRSLRKSVWWLQYKGEGHILYQDKNRIDFQSKVQDFFNVYLKDSMPPEWMTNHIKAPKTN